jgi:putative ABC transport system permease protein
MNRWLADFAYRISIGPAVFVIAGALAFMIACLTMSFQTIRAARANPVEALKYE